MKRIISFIVLAVWCGLLISMFILPVNVDAISTTIDNSSSSITYSGSGWVQENLSGDYNGSVSKSSTVNDYAEFNFSGAAVKVAIRRDTNYGSDTKLYVKNDSDDSDKYNSFLTGYYCPWYE